MLLACFTHLIEHILYQKLLILIVLFLGLSNVWSRSSTLRYYLYLLHNQDFSKSEWLAVRWASSVDQVFYRPLQTSVTMIEPGRICFFIRSMRVFAVVSLTGITIRIFFFVFDASYSIHTATHYAPMILDSSET